MHVELVETSTVDGVVLVGGYVPPDESAAVPGGADAVLMMHGNGGNFYHPFHRDLAARLAARGHPVLVANNRGHDVLSQAFDPWGRLSAPGEAPGGMYRGTALERIDECRADWDAWLGYLSRRGFDRAVVWGHSRGAVKTAYYLATARDPRVRRAVLSSPPWFSHTRWLASERAEEFRAHLSRAQGHVDAGRPDALLWVTLPTEYVCGAASYLDSYGPADRYDVVRLVEEIRCPVLVTTGTAEVASLFPFRGLAEALDEVCARNDHLTHVSVPGGDHMYTGRRDFVVDRVAGWLAT